MNDNVKEDGHMIADVGITTSTSKHKEISNQPPLLKSILGRTHQVIFNQTPIRLLAFKSDGSGIKLAERNEIWRIISRRIEADFNEDQVNNTIHRIQNEGKGQMAAAEKTAISDFVSRYTRFAILSHPWLQSTPGEVTYTNWRSEKFRKDSAGYTKLASFCRVAATEYGYTLAWMDTICINKESSSELDESIRSTYNWYRSSSVCITYLADTTLDLQFMHKDTWFTRGWTLQEMLAPRSSSQDQVIVYYHHALLHPARSEVNRLKLPRHLCAKQSCLLCQNCLHSNMKSTSIVQLKDMEALAPPGGKRYHDWIQAAFKHLPLAQLPSFLLPRPSPKQRLQPPRLHFGWPFTADYIIDTGKRKNFVTTGVFHVPEPMEYVQLEPTEKRIQDIILLELGVPVASCSPRVLRAFAPFSDYFLALTNNYIHGDYMPPEEDIEKIKDYFGLEGPPLWYLDAEGYQRWGYHMLDKRKHS